MPCGCRDRVVTKRVRKFCAHQPATRTILLSAMLRFANVVLAVVAAVVAVAVAAAVEVSIASDDSVMGLLHQTP